MNLAADLSGLPRFAASTEWLARIRRQQAASMQQGFEKFLSTSGAPGPSALSPKQRRELFEEFVKWTRGSAGTSQQRP